MFWLERTLAYMKPPKDPSGKKVPLVVNQLIIFFLDSICLI